MECPELSISVGELLGVPRVTMVGAMDAWHDQAVSGILTAFRDQGTTSLVLDLAGMDFTGIDGATAMVNALRSLGPQICIHIVASGTPAKILHKAGFAPCVRLYASVDELAEYFPPNDDALTSRWLASGSEDTELPLAA